jgi:hypothetical protein
MVVDTAMILMRYIRQLYIHLYNIIHVKYSPENFTSFIVMLNLTVTYKPIFDLELEHFVLFLVKI